MAIARGVTSRLVEGIVRDLTADADLIDLCGNDDSSGIRIYKGPVMGAEGSVIPPQINVIPVSMPYEPGLANASTVERTIAITYFDFFDIRTPASGGTWAPDVLEHIAKLLMQGGADDNDLGRIVDPDAAPGAVGAAKYLNNAITKVVHEPWVASEGNVAIVHRLVVTFETRINQSMTRV